MTDQSRSASDEETRPPVIVIDPHDRRSALGLVLAGESASWGRAVDHRTGEVLHVIPSQRYEGLFHLASATSCTCSDFRIHGRQQPCKHVVAVRIVELLAETYQVLPKRKRQLRAVPTP